MLIPELQGLVMEYLYPHTCENPQHSTCLECQKCKIMLCADGPDHKQDLHIYLVVDGGGDCPAEHLGRLPYYQGALRIDDIEAVLCDRCSDSYDGLYIGVEVDDFLSRTPAGSVDLHELHLFEV